jgi:cytochrome P450
MQASPQAAQAPSERRFSQLNQPRKWPVVGSLLSLKPETAHAQFEQWARELGTPFRARLGPRYMVFVDDAQEVSRILKDRPGAFRRVRPLRSVFDEMGISGVFSAEGADWERQRRLVMRAFDPSRLKAYHPSLVQVTARLAKRFDAAAHAHGAQAQPLDLQAEFMRYTVDVTAGLAFGADINTLEGGEDRIQTHLDKIFPAITRRMTAPFAYWRHFKLATDRALDADLAHVKAAIDGFVAKARARMSAEPERAASPTNLIEALLASRDAPGSDFDDADVSGNVFTALLAGEDTTANTLAWLSHFLCDAPEVQAKLRQEVAAVLGTNLADWPLDVLTSNTAMPWMEAAIREAMRLKPVAPLLSHETNEALTVAGVAVRKGTPVCTLLRAAGLDPQLFAQPEKFDPSRWMNPDEAWQREAKKRLMPFGGGPRFCPGRYLAMLEIKMVAALMLQRFELHRTPGTQVQERYALSMMPKGLSVQLRRLA